MAATSSATTVWQGGLADGSGVTTPRAGRWGDGRELGSRTKRTAGTTSPEELLAAAHASCYCMQLVARARRGGDAAGAGSRRPRPSGRARAKGDVLAPRRERNGAGDRSGGVRGGRRLGGRELPDLRRAQGNVEITVEATLEVSQAREKEMAQHELRHRVRAGRARAGVPRRRCGCNVASGSSALQALVRSPGEVDDVAVAVRRSSTGTRIVVRAARDRRLEPSDCAPRAAADRMPCAASRQRGLRTSPMRCSVPTSFTLIWTASSIRPTSIAFSSASANAISAGRGLDVRQCPGASNTSDATRCGCVAASSSADSGRRTTPPRHAPRAMPSASSRAGQVTLPGRIQPRRRARPGRSRACRSARPDALGAAPAAAAPTCERPPRRHGRGRAAARRRRRRRRRRRPAQPTTTRCARCRSPRCRRRSCGETVPAAVAGALWRGQSPPPRCCADCWRTPAPAQACDATRVARAQRDPGERSSARRSSSATRR